MMGPQPIVRKCALQLRNRGSLNAVMAISPVLWRLCIAGPFISNPHPADEGYLTVHHEDFAMRAVIKPAQVRVPNVMIPLQLNSRIAQQIVISPRFSTAVSVENHVHFHASPRSLGQGLSKLLRYLALLKNK